MLGSLSSPIIDFCIGMAVFYFIMTMICATINEYFMDKVGKLRQKHLLEGIAGLFYDARRVWDFYKHPLVTALYRDEEAEIGPKKLDSQKTYKPGNDTLRLCTEPFKEILGKLPSYIPSRTFAAALLDLLPAEGQREKQGRVSQNIDRLRQMVIDCDNDKIRKALLPLINAAQDDVEKAQRSIEKWFDDTMDRVGGWFKRHAERWLLSLAFVVCLVLNADTFMVGKILWQDPERLAALVTEAQKMGTDDRKVSDQKQDIDNLLKEVNKKTSQLPIGWVWERSAKKEDPRLIPMEIEYKAGGGLERISFCWDKIIFKLIGLIFTTLAISLGAPFWTDLLNTFVNLRRSGKVPAKSGGETK